MCRVRCYARRDMLLQRIFRVATLTSQQHRVVKRLLKAVEKRWTDSYGFLRLHPHDGVHKILDNENPVLFTATYLYMLKRLGMLHGALRKRYKAKVIRMIDRLRLEPGLFNRYPGRGKKAFSRHFSRDEQIGLGVLDEIFDRELGYFKELYQYGKTSRLIGRKVFGQHLVSSLKLPFCYENRTWSSQRKHRVPYCTVEGIRQPYFMEYIRLGASVYSNTTSKKLLSHGAKCWLQMALRITRNRKKEITSGKILFYLRAETLRRGGELLKDEIIQYHQLMKRMYGPFPLRALLDIYYRNPRHPTRRLAAFLQ
ncbi:MAG: hypothetical protein EP343_00585 [Deltaproteobacteria bacterium]|nr:MAG: hypothetical protein EP343_00585 [Deltaproteobacteria bacterium]